MHASYSAIALHRKSKKMTEHISIGFCTSADDAINTIKAMTPGTGRKYDVTFSHMTLFPAVFEFVEHECPDILEITLYLNNYEAARGSLSPVVNVCDRVEVRVVLIWYGGRATGNAEKMMCDALGDLSSATCHLFLVIQNLWLNMRMAKAIARAISGARRLKSADLNLIFAPARRSDNIARVICDAVAQNTSLEVLRIDLDLCSCVSSEYLINRISENTSIKTLEYYGVVPYGHLRRFIISRADRGGMVKNLILPGLNSEIFISDLLVETEKFVSLESIVIRSTPTLVADQRDDVLFKNILRLSMFSPRMTKLDLPLANASDDVILALVASVPYISCLEELNLTLDMRKWSGRRFMEDMTRSPRLREISLKCMYTTIHPQDDIYYVFFGDFLGMMRNAVSLKKLLCRQTCRFRPP